MPMTEELVTAKNPDVQTFFSQARELTEMFEGMAKNVRPPLAGRYFIDDKELAKRLSLSRRTLQSYRDNNVIPYYKIGGKTLYDEAEIDQWLSSSYHPKY
ncbi:MAG: helix-turn-helix domain-containing protein [Muribaculaceae bacterium]|nr:helix-turn-helix domain-containing protein [Muribaculaceae bacterium]